MKAMVSSIENLQEHVVKERRRAWGRKGVSPVQQVRLVVYLVSLLGYGS